MKEYKIKNIRTMIAVILFITAGLMFFSRNERLKAQPVSDSDVAIAERRVQTFFETLTLKDPSETAHAYSELFQGSPIAYGADDVISETVKKTNDLTSNKRWSFEPLDTRKAGKDLILIRYLYKGETFPVVWQFTFYRSQILNGSRSGDVGTMTSSQWDCIGVKFDTNLDVLINSGSQFLVNR
ncbi:MAG: hypothetical protein FWC50_12640 [Planctomycetaceae bacterium]|nr:hypothetical protein [Planctomycetaceae bacterium]